jgi:hypothetical protein
MNAGKTVFIKVKKAELIFVFSTSFLKALVAKS